MALVIIAMLAFLAVTGVLLWIVFSQIELIEILRFRIEMLEHPERFPPQHPNCRCIPAQPSSDDQVTK